MRKYILCVSCHCLKLETPYTTYNTASTILIKLNNNKHIYGIRSIYLPACHLGS